MSREHFPAIEVVPNMPLIKAEMCCTTLSVASVMLIYFPD